MNSRLRNLCVIAFVAALLSGCSAVAGSRSTSVSPTSVAFGGVSVNSTAQQTVTVTNTGSSPLQVQSVSVSGSNAFTVSGWTGKTQLRPSSTLQLTVIFSPTSTATFTGTLNVVTNASSQAVALSGSGVSTAPTPTTVAIAISPTTASLQSGQSKQFTATVSGTTNTAVTWLVNNIVGGNGTVGTISTTGLYTAPAVSASTTVSVTAQSVADTTKAASATVTVSPAPTSISVTVSPATAALQTGVTQQFTATVSGTTNTAVNWAVDGVAGGNTSVGTISSVGLYTAPTVSSTTTETITAVSGADATKSGSATATVSPAATAVTVAVSPSSATVAGGASQQFSATVNGTSNTAVNWLVNGVAGGSATYGNISQSGLYTAPPCPSTGSVTVTAVSAYDATAKANSAVTLTAPVASSTHYVAVGGNDSNDGSACRPWATIHHAASVVNPGETVIVGDGTYPENVDITRGGTDEAHRVVFKSQNKWGAHISGVNTSGSHTVRIDANYVTVQDFEVTGYPVTVYGIKHQGPYTHANIIGNNVHDIGVNMTACIQGAGIGANDSAIVDGNYIWNISSPRNASVTCNYQHGIYGLGGSNGKLINNVIFEIWQGEGITFNGSGVSYWTIANNTVFNVANPNTPNYAGGAYYMNCSGGTCDYNVWTNNIAANSYRFCFFEDTAGPGTIGSHNVYDHNLLYNCGTNYLTSGSPLTNSMTTDPQFINYTGDQNGNYHLRSTSPAINSGTTSGAPPDDFDSLPRPQGGAFDRGAYEYKP